MIWYLETSGRTLLTNKFKTTFKPLGIFLLRNKYKNNIYYLFAIQCI